MLQLYDKPCTTWFVIGYKNLSLVLANDFLREVQAEAGAFRLPCGFVAEAAVFFKDIFFIGILYACALVGHHQFRAVCDWLERQADAGIFWCVFHGIVEQVVHGQLQQQLVALDMQSRMDGSLNIFFGIALPEIVQAFFEQGAKVYVIQREAVAARVELGGEQHIVAQGVHAVGFMQCVFEQAFPLCILKFSFLQGFEVEFGDGDGRFEFVGNGNHETLLLVAEVEFFFYGTVYKYGAREDQQEEGEPFADVLRRFSFFLVFNFFLFGEVCRVVGVEVGQLVSGHLFILAAQRDIPPDQRGHDIGQQEPVEDKNRPYFFCFSGHKHG